jgi:hypothetical protein
MLPPYLGRAMSVGWFADIGRADDRIPGMFQPCLEMDIGVVPSFDIWFDTQEACEEFIRDTILPIAGKMADDEDRRA